MLKTIISVALSVLVIVTLAIGKPIAILHVGPHKTGTTSFQDTLFNILSADFESENYYNIPAFPNNGNMFHDSFFHFPIKRHAILAECLRLDYKNINCDKVFNFFSDHIQKMKEKKKNIILSSEGFDRFPMDDKHLFQILDGFEVHLVMVYREYVSQFLSFHNEFHKYKIKTQDIIYFGTNCLDLIKCGYYYMLTPLELMRRFSNYVEIDKMFIIDYLGVMNQKISIIEAVVKNKNIFPNLSKTFIEKFEIIMNNKSIKNLYKDSVENELCIQLKLTNEIDLKPIKNVKYCSECIMKNNKNLTIPHYYKCLNKEIIEIMKNKSFTIDNELRSKYWNNIIMGNERINRDYINNIINTIETRFCATYFDFNSTIFKTWMQNNIKSCLP